MTSRLSPLLRATRSAASGSMPVRVFSSAPRALAPSSFESALSSSSSTPSINTPLPLPTRLPLPPSINPSPDTQLLATLSRLIMKSGKLARAHSHLSICLSTLSLSTSSPPVPILARAIEIVSPSIRIVGRRKGTKVLPTPQPLTAEQRRRQAWKWIVEASEKREGQEKIFGKRLAAEVLAVLGGQSEAIKKKEAKHLQGVTGRANVGR
ncbi:small subunit ribosomal protein S7, partial [Phenoliferia sp. Uapishka_3]